ncbi:MAG: metallophosphoesterase [Candidatus Woesearchaeota archaeon]|nr:metallophosphoesterase [Candidatus Woesearchaeota archaeon]
MEPYIVSDTVHFYENSIFLPQEQTLVISDTHLGYEQQLRAMGHNIEYGQEVRMLKLLKEIIKESGATKLVINGDVKHEFGRISGQEWRDIMHLLEELKKQVEIVIVKGNHDTMTHVLAEKSGVPFVDTHTVGAVHILHGHELPEEEAACYIIGHVHPAITLHDGIRKETYKCFLDGKYKKSQLLVLPSFSTITHGSDILSTDTISPMITTYGNFDVFVQEDEIRAFGKVKKLATILDMI